MGGGGLAVSHPASATMHSGMNNLDGLADWTHWCNWRHKRRQVRQLEAAKVSASKAMQLEPTGSSRLDEKVEAAGAEEMKEENLPPVLHA